MKHALYLLPLTFLLGFTACQQDKGQADQTARAASGALVVDASSFIGPAQAKASGIHGGIFDEPDSLIDAIRISCVRVPRGERTWAYAAENDMTVIMYMHGTSMWDDWPRWEENLRKRVKLGMKHKDSVEVIYDIHNEPNLEHFWPGTQDEFFSFWRKSYKIIRELDPDATITGPSTCNYDYAWLQAFLKFAKHYDVLPDVLGWHEIEYGCDRYIPRHVAQMKAFLEQEGIAIKRFQVNEFATKLEDIKPGVLTSYFAQFERVPEIELAAKAYWYAPQGLSSLLTEPGYKPRSAWHAYKAYADITGKLCQVDYTDRMDAVAGYDENKQEINLLVGFYADNLEANQPPLLIKNIATEADKAAVKIWHIPYSGLMPLEELPLLMDAEVAIENKQLKLDLPELAYPEALQIKITLL